MSHEIRTPLNGVIGSHGLVSEIKYGKHHLEYMSTVNQNNFNAYYKRYSRFSKIEAGKLALETNTYL
jgi:signal transduction histidine kinase